ncbi:Membrane protein insertase YidC [Novipirellula galeiformis]|uniref:Membrane protein insertase YidC n=2 Tax=Novipirellula galeiformis TaxID=2528004 RepID=A0A5C6CLI0_9BACT|nr:Membrane protein insertase YidC [Novipirellula galeiformis]
MERRLLTFIIYSTAFLAIYVSLRHWVMPPPKPIAKDEQQIAAPLEDEPKDIADADLRDPQSESDALASDPVKETTEATEPGAPRRPSKPQWVTLGSMDPNSGYVMLVTLNSLGGAIERIELVEREPGKGNLKYRRVDVRSGYMGYFAATPADAADGVVVNVVGPGTPAQMAGIEVGDIITEINGKSIVRRDDIDSALTKTKPGESVKVAVLRSTASTADTDADDPAAPSDTSSLTSTSLTVKLSEHPLDLIRLARDGGADQVKGNDSELSCLMTLAQVNRKGIIVGDEAIQGISDPANLVWSIDSPSATTDDDALPAIDALTFRLALTANELEKAKGEALQLVRTYRLPKESYVIDMGIEVENQGDQPHDLAYRLAGPNGLTLEGWWYSTKISPNFSGAAARDIVYTNAANRHELVSGYDLLKLAKKQPEDPDQSLFSPDLDEKTQALKYVAVDAQYFVAAYLPEAGQTAFTDLQRVSAGIVADADRIERHKERAVNTSFYLTSNVRTVKPGESLKHNLRFFAGPKEPDLVEKYGLGDTIYYGWFAPFAVLLASLLHVIGGSIGNYAIAIILLTVLVRGLMFPLSRKAAINAQRMQELAPELKKIAEKYKDDMEGRLKAQRELQTRVGFNPMAGCLPMFLQLPIFIGLYRALSVDIELRQKAVSSATSWASNLAGPDMAAYWGDWMWDYLAGRGTGWLGPYFNILPVFVVGLFLLQQKLFMPPATDEQTAMTQKMMNIMTLMMGLFFFRVPAGLCIYFITSSLWGICERVLVKKTLPAKQHFDLGVVEGTAVPTVKKDKPLTIADRIRNQVNKPEEPVERPNKRRRPDLKKKR